MPGKKFSTLPVGKLLSQRYAILKKLGEGGYGTVYLAEDMRLAGRKVAIKELLETTVEAQALFANEATLLASLNHPGLVRVSDFFGDGRSYYLVMDYIEGKDLMDLMADAEIQHCMLPAEQVADWMMQVCDAVAYLHGRNPPIIHRDIKPNNVRLTTYGQAVLVDFGIAKADPKAKTVRIAKAVSLGFSPPEQYGGGGMGTDARSDVYALGATLYCLLTLQVPVDSSQRLIDNKPLIPLRQLNPMVSQQMEIVVEKALSLNSLHRYQDAGELLSAIKSASSSSGHAPIKRGQQPAGNRCPKCNNTPRSGARFCPKCGTTIGSAVGAPVVDRCPACGVNVRSGARFCSSCRTNLNPCRPVITPQINAPAQAYAAVVPALSAMDIRQAQQAFSNGRNYFAGQQYAQAASELEKAMQCGLNTPSLVFDLGKCYLELKQFDRAMIILESAVQRYPREADIQASLAQAYLGANKLTQCIQTLENAYTIDPQNIRIAQQLARLYRDLGRHDQAIPIMEKLMEVDPHDADLAAHLAYSYLINNQISEAEGIVHLLKAQSPNHQEICFISGIIQLRKRNFKLALKELNQVIKLDAGNALGYYFIGEVFIEQKKWVDAVRSYQSCLHLSPDDADAHARLSLCYLMIHRTAEAMNELQIALRLDPNHPFARQIQQQFLP